MGENIERYGRKTYVEKRSCENKKSEENGKVLTRAKKDEEEKEATRNDKKGEERKVGSGEALEIENGDFYVENRRTADDMSWRAMGGVNGTVRSGDTDDGDNDDCIRRRGAFFQLGGRLGEA